MKNKSSKPPTRNLNVSKSEPKSSGSLFTSPLSFTGMGKKAQS